MALNAETRLKELQTKITAQVLTDVAYPVFVKNTPVKSGNARRHTIKASTEIDANYPYAVRLDKGWSKQSPKGMVAPTVDAVRAYIRKVLGN
jgi:hypothetical protein